MPDRGSFNGRTSEFDSDDEGSTPSPRADPDTVTMTIRHHGVPVYRVGDPGWQEPYEPDGGRTGCWACNGSGCGQCTPDEYETGEP